MQGEAERQRVAAAVATPLGEVRAPRATSVPPRLLHAIVEAIAPDPPDVARLARVVAFVHAQHGELPFGLRALLALGLTGFRALVVLRHARGFCALDLATRRRVVRAWSYGWFPPGRQLFRVLRGPALLAWYDLPAEPRP